MAQEDTIGALVGRAKAGDREAFEKPLDANRSVLEYLIRSRLGTALRRDADVEDVLQETSLPP